MATACWRIQECSALFGHGALPAGPDDMKPALSILTEGSSTFSPRSLLLRALNSFLRCVRPFRRCWFPPFSAGHVALLLICLPGLSLLVSAMVRWPCSISIHLSPRSVTGGVRPFPVAM